MEGKKTRVISIERDFDDHALAEKGKDLARIMSDIEHLEADKKANASMFKGRIDEKLSEAQQIGKIIRLGFENVDVECDMLLNTPELGKKTYIDIKTGLTAKVMDMEPHDGQSRLFDADERPDPQQAAAVEEAEHTDVAEDGTVESDPSHDAEFTKFMDGISGSGEEHSSDEPPSTEDETPAEEEGDRSHENRPRGGRRGRKPKDSTEAPPPPPPSENYLGNGDEAQQ